MSEAKFTRGEWRLGMVAGKFNISVVDGSSQVICEMPKAPVYDEHVRSNIFGNAHLIAAAPEMYDLLEKVKSAQELADNEIEHSDNLHELYGDIKKLLAKARGES